MGGQLLLRLTFPPCCFLFLLVFFYTYHRNNRLPPMRDLHTPAAVGGAVPGLAAESRAVQAGGEFVG